MTNYNDNGDPAFPSAAPPEHCGGPSRGMTVRDYFAGQALAGMCADGTATDGMTHSRIAQWCYEMADAMLEVRK